MRKLRSIRVASLGLVFPLLLAGCGNDDPDPAATASGSPTPAPVVTKAPTTQPTASNTPDPHFSPLGGKPATEAEKKYYNAQKKAEDIYLGKDYKAAIPLFDELVKEQPEDAENYFYLMLAHGWTEDRPHKDSDAYKNASKVLELKPGSKHAERATRYQIAAEFNEPGPKHKYKLNTRNAQGGKFEHYPDETYKLAADTPFHTELAKRLDKDGEATLWEGEISPKHHPTETVPKGQMVRILGEQAYFYSLNSWRKPVRQDMKKYNTNIFDVSVFYVQVVSEGDFKGKEGWMVHHMDRWVDRLGADPWVVWVSNRVDLSKPFKGGEAVIPADQVKPPTDKTPEPAATKAPKSDPTPEPDEDEDEDEDGLPD